MARSASSSSRFGLVRAGLGGWPGRRPRGAGEGAGRSSVILASLDEGGDREPVDRDGRDRRKDPSRWDAQRGPRRPSPRPRTPSPRYKPRPPIPREPVPLAQHLGKSAVGERRRRGRRDQRGARGSRCPAGPSPASLESNRDVAPRSQCRGDDLCRRCAWAISPIGSTPASPGTVGRRRAGDHHGHAAGVHRVDGRPGVRCHRARAVAVGQT